MSRGTLGYWSALFPQQHRGRNGNRGYMERRAVGSSAFCAMVRVLSDHPESELPSATLRVSYLLHYPASLSVLEKRSTTRQLGAFVSMGIMAAVVFACKRSPGPHRNPAPPSRAAGRWMKIRPAKFVGYGAFAIAARIAIPICSRQRPFNRACRQRSDGRSDVQSDCDGVAFCTSHDTGRRVVRSVGS